MKTRIGWSALSLTIGLFIGCSPVKFSSVAQNNCENGQACITANGDYEYGVIVHGPKVDILIVNDNSASMSYEQARLAQRFNNFISLLDSRKVDYRIAMTTTDVSSSDNAPRSVNLNGGLQDGNLVTFSNGSKFITPDMGSLSDKTNIFNQAINRSETLACEQFIINWVNAGKSRASAEYSSQYYANCPSGDERGIYALNLAVKKNSDSFIRPNAQFAAIILSDEDVRSQLYHGYYNTPGYNLDPMDEAPGFINQMANLYPGKGFSVHSIVVKDSACLGVQNSQTLGVMRGSYGNKYIELSNSTNGVSADICANDYTTQLGQIGSNIIDRVKNIALYCENPKDFNVTLSTDDSSIEYNVVGKELVFNKELPVGTSVHLKYKCN